MITCDDELCVYWDNGVCICDSVHHNAVGLCEDGIHIYFDPQELEVRRKSALLEMEKRDAKYF